MRENAKGPANPKAKEQAGMPERRKKSASLVATIGLLSLDGHNDAPWMERRQVRNLAPPIRDRDLGVMTSIKSPLPGLKVPLTRAGGVNSEYTELHG
jgi:hypothetical protein